MSALRSVAVRSSPGQIPDRSAATAAALLAVQAAAVSCLPFLVPATAAWTASAWTAPGGADLAWSAALRIVAAAWLLAQHAGLAVIGGHVGLVPVGLAAIPLLSCWFAGRRLARHLYPVNPTRTVLLAFIGTYVAIAVAMGLFATTAQVRPVMVQVVLGSALTATVGGYTGVAAGTRGGAVAGLRASLRALRPPAAVRPWMRPALAAVAIQLVAAVVLVLVCLAVSMGDVLAVHRALGAGVVGGGVLALIQAAVLPNLVIWAAAFLAGPGFAVGVGTSVTPAASSLGSLPAFPVLAALPAPGEMPNWVLLLLIVPFVAGAGAALLLRASHPELEPHELVRQMPGVAGLAAALMLVLAWLSGGPAGPGRLGMMGPQPVVVALVFGCEVAAGGLLALVGAQVGRGLRQWPARD